MRIRVRPCIKPSSNTVLEPQVFWPLHATSTPAILLAAHPMGGIPGRECRCIPPRYHVVLIHRRNLGLVEHLSLDEMIYMTVFP